MTTSAPSSVSACTYSIGSRSDDVCEPDVVVSQDVACELEAPGLGLEEMYDLCALGEGERRVGRADRAGADDDDRLTGPDAEILVAADCVRERIGEGRGGRVEALGHAIDVLQGHVRNRDELGVGAGIVESHEAGFRAEVLVAASAHPADAAVESRDHVHEVAGRGVELTVGLGADLQDLARDLVPQDPPGPDAPIAVVERANVGSADPARDDPEQGAVGRAGGVRRLLERHLPGALPDGCSHPSARIRSRSSALARATCERPRQHDFPHRSSQDIAAWMRARSTR